MPEDTGYVRCSFESCRRSTYARGLCSTHYRAVREALRTRKLSWNDLVDKGKVPKPRKTKVDLWLEGKVEKPKEEHAELPTNAPPSAPQSAEVNELDQLPGESNADHIKRMVAINKRREDARNAKAKAEHYAQQEKYRS